LLFGTRVLDGNRRGQLDLLEEVTVFDLLLQYLATVRDVRTDAGERYSVRPSTTSLMFSRSTPASSTLTMIPDPPSVT